MTKLRFINLSDYAIEALKKKQAEKGFVYDELRPILKTMHKHIKHEDRSYWIVWGDIQKWEDFMISIDNKFSIDTLKQYYKFINANLEPEKVDELIDEFYPRQGTDDFEFTFCSTQRSRFMYDAIEKYGIEFINDFEYWKPHMEKELLSRGKRIPIDPAELIVTLIYELIDQRKMPYEEIDGKITKVFIPQYNLQADRLSFEKFDRLIEKRSKLYEPKPTKNEFIPRNETGEKMKSDSEQIDELYLSQIHSLLKNDRTLSAQRIQNTLTQIEGRDKPSTSTIYRRKNEFLKKNRS